MIRFTMSASFRIFCILFSFFLFSDVCQSNAQSIPWARSFGGADWDYVSAIEYDASGNMYITGSFNSTTDMDPGLGTFNMTSAGYDDAYITKLDAAGNLIWSKQIGAAGPEYVAAMAIDQSGNLILTGQFIDTVDFDPGPGVFNMVGSQPTMKPFVLKLDAAGNFLWAKQIGGEIRDVKTDVAGNIYVTGHFSTANYVFDPTGAINLPYSGQDDAYVLKLDAAGNYQWAKSFGGSGRDEPSAIAIDKPGNIYITGSFSDTSDFDPGPGVANLTTPSPGWISIFLCKLNSSGDYVWANGIGGPSQNYSRDIVLDTSGRPIITGMFSGTVDLDPGSSVFNLSASPQSLSLLLAQYDTAGNFRWGNTTTTTGGTTTVTSAGSTLAVDNLGNVFLAGNFLYTTNFATGGGGNELVSAGDGDIFIAKYHISDGSLGWAYRGGSPRVEYANAISADASGNLWVAGSFIDTNFSIGIHSLVNTQPSYSDVFIIKMNNLATRTDDVVTKDQISVYPNPSTGIINISSKNNIDKIIVTDVVGKSVYSSTPKTANALVSITTPGMYFVTVVSGEQRMTKKILIEK